MSKIAVPSEIDEKGGSSNVTYKSPEEIEAMEKVETTKVVDDATETTEETTEVIEEAKVVNIGDVDYILDEKGDALNEDGSIFKTKVELETETEEVNEEVEQIDIGGEIFTLDKDGNALNDKNEIVHTAEDLASMEDAADVIDIADITKDTAIVVYNEDGVPVEYENNKEGYASHTTDVYSKGGQDAVGQLYEAYPEVQALVNHIQLGGNADNFKTRVDYSKVKLAKDNEAQLKDIIYKARTARGDRLESIDRYYNAIKAGDTDNDAIFDEAGLELKYMQDSGKAEVDADNQRLADLEADNTRQNNEFWGVSVVDNKLQPSNQEGSIYDIVSKGKVKLGDKTFNIPEKIRVVQDGKPQLYDRNDFFNYLYSPITVNVDGKRTQMTRHDLDLENETRSRTSHNEVYDAYKRFVKYDDSQLIEEQVQNRQVKKIRKLKSKKVTSPTAPKPVSTVKKIIFKQS